MTPGRERTRLDRRSGEVRKPRDVREEAQRKADATRTAELILDGLQKISQDSPRFPLKVKSFCDCGRRIIPESEVTFAANGDEGHFRGLIRCNSVHLCPICGNVIRAEKRKLLDAATTWWAAGGHGLAMGTYTLNHHVRDRLELLIKVQRETWRRAFGSGRGKKWTKIVERYGLVGDVRTFEATHGGSGWHPHFHVLYFTERPLTLDEKEELEDLLFAKWRKAHREAWRKIAGQNRDVKKSGFKLDVAKKGDELAFARYITMEITGDRTKKGKKGNRTPMEIGEHALDETRSPEQRQRDTMLWREWAAGSKGVQWQRISDKLNEVLAEPFEQAAEEMAEEEAEERRLTRDVFAIRKEAWYRVIRAKKGRTSDFREAWRHKRSTGVRDLIESWGLSWGYDVVPIPRHRAQDDADDGSLRIEQPELLAVDC